MTTKVLISSASPDRVNHNAVLRNYVMRGFRDVVGVDNALACSFDHAAEAAKRFQPDIVVVFGSCMPDCSDFTSLRTYCSRSGAALVFWLHDDPYEFDFNYKIYSYADMIFSNDAWAAEHFDHPRVAHLPLAADRSSHFREVRVGTMVRDVFFCGVGFPNRRELMRDCADVLGGLRVEVLGSDWPEELAFCKNVRVPNEALPELYATSVVTLNVGRRFNLANSKYLLDAVTPGPRTFEAAMAGAVQCAYFECPELLRHFEPETEILLFDSPRELRSLVEDLIANPERRWRIASNAQARALRSHTYTARAQAVLDALAS